MHRINQNQAGYIAKRVASWPNLIEYGSDVAVPSCPISPTRCQRLFVQGKGSQYSEVHQFTVDGSSSIPMNGEAVWAQMGEEMEKIWAKEGQLAQTIIQEGEQDEANLWLERTQWLECNWIENTQG